MAAPPPNRRASRLRYRDFRRAHRLGTLDQTAEDAAKSSEAPASPGLPGAPDKDKKGRRREHLRAYMQWLWPHRFSVAAVFGLALVTAGLQMVEPLFMRFIIDGVLLNTTLDAASRLTRLNLGGAGFLTLIVLSNLTSVMKDYRQKLLNTRVMLSLRRSLFDRMLHLPLPTLWDMKTGGILSRLSGDVDTTTGLMQLAIVSPAVSLIRLLVAVGILMGLNWRLALTAIAIIPGAMLMSFVFAKRV
ncbi:MAG TPA: ABC transporter ATP-binding protein, partial [Vicinamibacterales bacterium]|nr:ABC transporter ATP-binding protein [Vicinamibacterales bacterium]